jgi:hypothetical protein
MMQCSAQLIVFQMGTRVFVDPLFVPNPINLNLREIDKKQI